MADEESTHEAESASAAEVIAEETGGGRRKLFAIVGIVAVAAIAGGAGLFFLRAEPEQTVAEAGPSEEELRELAKRYGVVDGVDYAEELDVDLPPMPEMDVAAGDEDAEGEGTPAAPSHMGRIFNLQPFVVNISDRDRDRYLKLKADLELSDDAVAEELEQRLPQVRDLIISLLGGKSFEDIRTIEGKNFLREEMLLRINALLVSGKARRVFFTEFVVQ